MQIGAGRLSKAGLLLILGVLLGLALVRVAPDSSAQPAIEWLDRPRPLRDFHLQSDAGEFDLRSLHGRWTLVAFGFVHCPDVCPITLSNMADIARNLAGNSNHQEINFVFVSVDPRRDAVVDVGSFVRSFHPAILGVTGPESQLARLGGDLGLRFEVAPDPNAYTVMHSVKFSIVGPKAQLRGRFEPGPDMSNLARQLETKLATQGPRITAHARPPSS